MSWQNVQITLWRHKNLIPVSGSRFGNPVDFLGGIDIVIFSLNFFRLGIFLWIMYLLATAMSFLWFVEWNHLKYQLSCSVQMMFQLLWLMKHLTPAKHRQQQTPGPAIRNSGANGPSECWELIGSEPGARPAAQTQSQCSDSDIKSIFNNVNVTLWELNQWHLSVVYHDMMTVMTLWPHDNWGW